MTDPRSEPTRTESTSGAGRIEKLDRSVVDRIAAGEVVTRPASVVTELLENSLDAGASRVTVSVDEGGIERIRVADDGRGMDREDASLAVERHTTSKIRAPEDVARVDTLGFRGEALASIARMGTLALTTNAGGTRATQLTVAGGEKEVTIAGRDVGTTVTVTDLFERIPARRKGLASTDREFAAISEAVTGYGLCRPDVRFTLEHNDQRVFSTPGSGSYTDAALGIYGREVASQSTELAADTNETSRSEPNTADDEADAAISVTGLLVHPSVTRASANYVHTAVNGRTVRNETIRQAALAGYRSLLPTDRYPICVLDVSMPPEGVDVNVHPAKAEIAFRDPDRVGEIVEERVRDAFSGVDLARVADLGFDLDDSLEPIEGESLFEACTVIGQFREAYLLCERNEDLLVIDQHAAHERINYERLRNAVLGDEGIALETRSIDPPRTVALSPGKRAVLESEAGRLAALGYTVAESGGGMVRVSRVPAPFGRVADPESIRSVLGALETDHEVPDPREELLKTLSCHPSLKAGDALDGGTAKRLLVRLGECEQPFACPHGRPTVLSIDERAFVRGFDRSNRRLG